MSGDTPFASQLEDINKYIERSHVSGKNETSNNITAVNYNQDLKSIKNSSPYFNVNQSHLNQNSNAYQNSNYYNKYYNSRRDSLFSTNGQSYNGYSNSRKNRNMYHKSNDYSMNFDHRNKAFVTDSTGSNHSRRQRNVNNNVNNTNRTYNQNINFTNYLKETYPQFYTESHHSEDNHHNSPILTNNTNSSPEGNKISGVDPNRTLLVTSLYNTYSQNSALNKFNKYGTSEKGTQYSMGLNGPTNAYNKSSLFENFNMNPIDSSLHKFPNPAGKDGIDMYSSSVNQDSITSSYGNNNIFSNSLSPTPSNDINFRRDLTSTSCHSEQTTNVADQLMNNGNADLANSNDSFSTGFMQSPQLTMSGFPSGPIQTNITNSLTSYTNRNMYLSQTSTPQYNKENNHIMGSFSSFGMGFQNGINENPTSFPIANGTNIVENTTTAPGIDRSFSIWNKHDMKVWS